MEKQTVDTQGSSVDALIDRALTAVDDDARAERVAALHILGGTRVYARARALFESASVRERALGVDILGQLGAPEGRPFLEETLVALRELCAREQDPDVRSAVVAAFGHLGDGRALQDVLRFTGNENAGLRQSVAFALPSLIDEEDAGKAGAAVEALVALTKDPDEEVRDWATFGLAQLQADSTQVRDALVRRLADENPDVAGEALVGLARRGDPRSQEAVRRRLADADADLFVLEAAAELHDPGLLPLLKALEASGWDPDGPEARLLQDAIEQYGSSHS